MIGIKRVKPEGAIDPDTMDRIVVEGFKGVSYCGHVATLPYVFHRLLS